MSLPKRALSADVSRETVPEDLVGAIISGLDEAELLRIRALIDQKLGISDLESLDLGQEIMVQLRTLKVLQTSALADGEAQHQHKASAAMTVSRMLQELAKARDRLAKYEVSRKIDAFVVEAMRDAPKEVKDAFFANLERLMASLPSMSTMVSENTEEATEE